MNWNRNLAIACAVACALLIGSYLGMCSSLEMEVGHSLSKGSVGPLLFAVIFGAAAVFFWTRRGRPMS